MESVLTWWVKRSQIQLLFLSLLLSCTPGIGDADPNPDYSSREMWGVDMWNYLKWGFSTSAYQIEGGWDEDGKGPSIWDNFTHSDPTRIKDASNGDIACDSYHKWEEDVELLASVQAQVYRFSISWSRLLRNGRKDSFDPKGAGVRYYNALLNELVAKGIEPIVTLHHFDLPQALEDEGGFLNETLIINSFADYADIAFATFGDRVQSWITFNEPWIVCIQGYETGLFPPGKVERDPKKGSLLCGHNLLKAHATAYRLYQKKYKEKQGGRIGLSLFAPWFDNFPWLNPQLQISVEGEDEQAQRDRFLKQKKKDDIAVELAKQEVMGWFLEPVIRGSYPTALNDIYGRENVHNFTLEWVNMINGSFDYLGVNHYTTFQIADGRWHSDENKMDFFFDPSSPTSGSKWLRTEPHGIRDLLNWLKKEYSDPIIYITENGFSDRGDTPAPRDIMDEDIDTQREDYLRKYLAQLKLAVVDDLVNVQVYAVWSLLDNFELLNGYTERFGVFYVDFTSPDRTRTAKSSACLLDWTFNAQRDKGIKSLIYFQTSFVRGCRDRDFDPRVWHGWDKFCLRFFQVIVVLNAIIFFAFCACICILLIYSCYKNGTPRG